jgi:WD40 repeat protein
MNRIRCLLVMVILLAACSNQEDDYVLFIEHRSDDRRQLYQVNPSDSQVRLLMEIPVRDLYWVSPKGSYVAVVQRDGASQTSLMTLYDLATQEIVNTLENVGQFNFDEIPYVENVVWAPDERAFVFLRLSDEGNGTDLWLYDVEGANLRPLSEDEAVDRAPSWSPDGSQLAYARLPTCEGSAWRCPDESTFWEVKVLHVAEEESQVVVDQQQIAGYQQDVAAYQRSLCNFTWSPDSEYLLFEDGCRPIGPSTYKELYLVSVNARNLFRLTDFSDGSLIRTTATWTADAEHVHIAYAKAPFGPGVQEAALSTSIVILDTAHLSIEYKFPLMNNEALPQMAWSRDGTSLAAFPFDGETIIAEFHNAELAVNPSLQLPVGNCFPPQWSPSRNYVAYLTTPETDDPCPSEANYLLTVVSPAGDVISDLTEGLEDNNRIIGWYPRQ